jgi:dihydropteroate synthase
MTNDPFIFTFKDFTLNFRTGCKVMSILNVTPDSFSDGGNFLDRDAAIEQALLMSRDGADILDVGGESTRPNAAPVSAAEEIARVVPIIETLAKKISIPISIDTYKAAVAEAAVRAGASMVNDISGFHFDKDLIYVCKKYAVPAVAMHVKSKPQDMTWSFADTTVYADIIAEVKAFLSDSLAIAEAAGVHQVIVDVGFGFGKSVAGNFELIRRLAEFKSLGKPILIGVSRKSSIGKILEDDHGLPRDITDRLYGTCAANVIAVMNGANILRVHDTKAAKDVIRVAEAIAKP